MNDPSDELKTVAILALQAPVIAASREEWQRTVEQLSSRLCHPVSLVEIASDDEDCDDLVDNIEWFFAQGYRRFVIMPVGLEEFGPLRLRTLIFSFHAKPFGPQMFLAKNWATKDWAEAIHPCLVQQTYGTPTEGRSKNQNGTIVLLSTGAPSGSNEDDETELASMAYHLLQPDENLDVRYAFLKGKNPSLAKLLSQLDSQSIQRITFIPWRMDSDQIEDAFWQLGQLHATEITPSPFGSAFNWDRLSTTALESIGLIEQSGWMHVALGKYLEALASRSIERYFAFSRDALDTDSDNTRLALIELDRRIDAMLPSQYQGRTDEVKPQSMGSASIDSDQFGEVAWDEIWTSFCDLAMAGGPPHRGRLLEAISAESASRDLPAYRLVVQEIRRGIEMVTGLKTLEAATLGWVGVECDDETMAVWLMRAIIVENIMVRREESTLFLPAGPKFRVKKEIKNVITSVAKTVHYWRAHLRRY